MHVSHVVAQGKPIGRHLATQRARNGHLIVTSCVLAQAALVSQPRAADAALNLRPRFIRVYASIVHVQLGFVLERVGADVANVVSDVHALDVRGYLIFGEEAI